MPDQAAIYKGMYDEQAAMTPERLDYLRDNLKIEYGGGTRPQEQGETREGQGWTLMHSLPEAAGVLGSEYARSAIDPIMRVGGVLTGKPPPVTVDEINDVGTLNRAAVGDVMGALSVYGGGGVLRGRPSATSVGILGGEGAKEAPLRMMEIAKKAIAAGKDPDEVWKWTGSKPGMEGKMRWEFSDKDMTVNPEFWGPGGAKHSAWMDPKKNQWADVRMGQVVKHDKAYANYPEMRGVKVRLGEPEMMGNRNGFFDETTNTATIKSNLTRDEARETLLHEVGAHYVQGKEGFARGGTVSANWGDPNVVRAAIKRAEVDGKNWLELKTKERLKYVDDVAWDNYQNIAGEIEARDITARRTWDDDMRRAVPPAFRKDAIIRMGDR